MTADPGAINPQAPGLNAPGADPGCPQPGSPEPGSPEPGSPEPGSPEPGSPEPGSPEPGSPDPGIPNRTGDPTHLRLQRASGALTSAALQRMDERLPWYRALGAEDRSWVGLVAQAGISSFLTWYGDQAGTVRLSSDVFGTAPRELTRSISLQRTLELLRTIVDVVESQVAQLAAPGAERELTDAALRYSRDIAFAAAEVYARAAEERGAWDARSEALVVDALVRAEAEDIVRSRAAAVGWANDDRVAVLAGMTPDQPTRFIVDRLRRAGRAARADTLVGIQGDRIIVVIGRSIDPSAVADDLMPLMAPGPVVVGPEVESLAQAGRSARAALAGLVAARAWPDAPRPVAADDLLPERMLSGDATARRALVDRIYQPMAQVDLQVLETVAAYLDAGRSVEAAARKLFVHPNTVRYRLRRARELTGWDPLDPREGYVLQMALTVGRLAAGPPGRS